MAAVAEPVEAPPPFLSPELKVQDDPTLLLRRAWADTEWNHFKDDREDLKLELGGLWSWRVSERQEWAVQLKLPVAGHVAGEAEGDADALGLGDIEVGTGTAFRLGHAWRTGGGLELRTPSATDDVLGDNVWRLKPFWAVAWDATGWLTLTPRVEYNDSFAEESGVLPQEYLEMYLPATFGLSRGWSVSTRYETKVDLERNDEWTHSAKLVLAKQLERLPLSFAVSLKKSFDGGDKQFQLNFTTTYFFRTTKRETLGVR
ncbi:MAG: hypothetical protein HS113_01075 [Verrucomicrobiales bacterium]|nr:hypothetical protein [Verrucomicrobiales bacterium]